MRWIAWSGGLAKVRNQAIELSNPGGVLLLMGVTEVRVPINTRDVLEKGITLISSSRSYSESRVGKTGHFSGN
ncbi:hypothetical protein [Paenibacillus ginsengarvi]|uniref:hypothetical protein n=1 Tax=Paenibacillus ginsengarvi TaxID=400777 RepID=UPI001F015A46|nr:hypothetical protein [Paenibacillus ginsengarvi]